eukprot:2145838-Alexandrium_andersonii.AAC.1
MLGITRIKGPDEGSLHLGEAKLVEQIEPRGHGTPRLLSDPAPAFGKTKMHGEALQSHPFYSAAQNGTNSANGLVQRAGVVPRAN